MSALRPDILVIGTDPAGIELALGAALARVPVVLVTQQPPCPRGAGGLDPLNRLAALGVKILEGQGRFRDSRHFFIEGTTITARRMVLAIPLAARVPEVAGLAAAPRWAADAPAQAVLILGGGAQAPALAHAVRQAGRRAVLVAPEGLLPGRDAEAGAIIAHHLMRAGVDLHAGLSLEGARVEPCPEGFLLHSASGAPLGFSHWCPAEAGTPALETLALEAAGVNCVEGFPFLRADELTTTNPQVLALGGTRSPEADAANAGAEAAIALGAILLRRNAGAALARLPRIVPGPLALLEGGLSEAQVAARPRGKTRYYRVPLAQGGLLKAITDSSGRVLRFCVLGQGTAALVAPLQQLMIEGQPLADLAKLSLPARDDAAALGQLGRMALAERFSGLGARLLLRLMRALG